MLLKWRGNPLPTGAETTRQPFRWNGAYGYTYQPFTGLYHLNPDYDPKTKRYLQRQGSNPANPYLHAENDPIDNIDIDERLGLLNTQGLVRRGLPRAQQEQLVQGMRTVAHTVAELHPGVLATEAAYGRDCSGQELSAWERLGKGVAAVAGSIGTGIGRAIQTVGRAGGRIIQRATQGISQGVARAKVWAQLRLARVPSTSINASVQTYKHAKSHNWSPPANYKGGRVFQNRENKLPQGGDYREFDIFPCYDASGNKVPRGPERIVVDIKSNRVWYTPDHYQTFIEITEIAK